MRRDHLNGFQEALAVWDDYLQGVNESVRKTDLEEFLAELQRRANRARYRR